MPNIKHKPSEAIPIHTKRGGRHLNYIVKLATGLFSSATKYICGRFENGSQVKAIEEVQVPADDMVCQEAQCYSRANFQRKMDIVYRKRLCTIDEEDETEDPDSKPNIDYDYDGLSDSSNSEVDCYPGIEMHNLPIARSMLGPLTDEPPGTDLVNYFDQNAKERFLMCSSEIIDITITTIFLCVMGLVFGYILYGNYVDILKELYQLGYFTK